MLLSQDTLPTRNHGLELSKMVDRGISILVMSLYIKSPLIVLNVNA